MSVSAEPRLFVDWSACERVLCSTLTAGVRVCCLLSVDGSVLCVGGELHAAKLLSALLSSVYRSYSDAGGEEWQSSDVSASVEQSESSESMYGGELLANLTVVCDDGAVSVARVGRFLVAVQCEGSQMGQVARKVRRYPFNQPASHTSTHTYSSQPAAHTATVRLPSSPQSSLPPSPRSLLSASFVCSLLFAVR